MDELLKYFKDFYDEQNERDNKLLYTLLVLIKGSTQSGLLKELYNHIHRSNT